jgi:hypothetical protein
MRQRTPHATTNTPTQSGSAKVGHNTATFKMPQGSTESKSDITINVTNHLTQIQMKLVGEVRNMADVHVGGATPKSTTSLSGLNAPAGGGRGTER